MINITNEAFKWFNSLKTINDNYLLISLKSSGCNGYKYELQWIDSLFKNVQYELKSFEYDNKYIEIAYPVLFKDKLDNVTIDLIKEGINKKIHIINPNVQNECGCGESIGF